MSSCSWCGLWTLGTFALTVNVLFVIGTIMADRLAYLPSAGFAIFVSGLLCRLPLQRLLPSHSAVVLLAVAVIAAYAALVEVRLPIWRDNQSLFSAAVRDNPRSTKATVALAEYWYYWAKDINQGEYWFRKTLELDPANVYAARHLVAISLRQERLASAEYFCREVLKYAPDDNNIREKLDALVKLRKAAP